jgi:hypothetical protein
MVIKMHVHRKLSTFTLCLFARRDSNLALRFDNATRRTRSGKYGY